MKKAAIRPLRTLPCACASVRRLARAMTQVYDRALRPCGLKTAQFTLLQALEEVGPVTQGRLGHALALDSTTLSRTLKPLEDRKWCRRWATTGGMGSELRAARGDPGLTSGRQPG